MHRVVVLLNSDCYRRRLDLETSKYGYYVLPHNHYSAGYIERVWNIDWEELDPLPVPSVKDLLNRQLTGIHFKYMRCN